MPTTIALPYTDTLTYATLVVFEEDGPRVRRRVSAYGDALTANANAMMAQYARAFGARRIEWRVGKLGDERLLYFLEDGAIYRIDGSGVPATVCADVDKFYPEED